jgi:hypothetical protein
MGPEFGAKSRRPLRARNCITWESKSPLMDPSLYGDHDGVLPAAGTANTIRISMMSINDSIMNTRVRVLSGSQPS